MTNTEESPEPRTFAPPIALSEGDAPAYAALSESAAFFAFPSRHISRFTGAKTAETLNGLVTNDVLPLGVGRGLYAAALQPKGKMLADLSIFRIEPEVYLVESGEHAGREWWSMIRKYVNPRLSQYTDESASYAAFGLYGPNAAGVLAQLATGTMGDVALTDAMKQGLEAWPDWAHSAFTLPGMPIRLIRAPYLGAMRGFEILVGQSLAAQAAQQLARGALIGSEQVFQLAQLECGRPVFGLDMDATTIPQEANLDDWNAISYEKGCYTGQETVARIHFRGHVNRHLRGLRCESLVRLGASIHDDSGKLIGEVRRSGLSPSYGNIAIGMVRRELATGATIVVRADGTEIRATLTALPFGG